jgi:uncharacterized protein YehS (DUF1456 family)
MKSKELSQFTNKELKDILKKNQVKNYSKLNKKDLIKKVNQLTNSQNGGGENKYTDVGGVRVPTHMLSSQRGQPPVQRVNIAQPPPPQLNAQRYPPPPPLNAQRHPPHHLPPPPPHPPQSGPRNAVQNRIRCPSKGWSQQINDCWIDSAYYAMFVPSNLKDWFFSFFYSISASQNEPLRTFAELSRQYLEGIDGTPAFSSKKQELKRFILRSIKEACKTVDRDLYKILNELAEITNMMASSGIMNKRGNGDASIFFKFISKIEARLIYLDTPSWGELLKNSNGDRVIQKYIRNQLRKITEDALDIDIVIINASYLKPRLNTNLRKEVQFCMDDNTVLQEILDINGFTLEAVIRGDNVHYRVDFRCSNNKWYNYDNQRRPNHIIEIYPRTRNWQEQDGLIFIFRRRP